jgi:hypothetical protein
MTKEEQLGTISSVLLTAAGWFLSLMPYLQVLALILSCLVSVVTLLSWVLRKMRGEKKGDKIFNHDE